MNFGTDELTGERAERAERMLKALANRHRLMILCELGKGEISVHALNDRLDLSQSALSQHLARLREDGMVQTRREAQTIFYSLCNEEVVQMITLLSKLYCNDDCLARDFFPGASKEETDVD